MIDSFGLYAINAESVAEEKKPPVGGGGGSSIMDMHCGWLLVKRSDQLEMAKMIILGQDSQNNSLINLRKILKEISKIILKRISEAVVG